MITCGTVRSLPWKIRSAVGGGPPVPSQVSTSATDGASRLIASPSSTVSPGRLIRSTNEAPDEKLTAPKRWTKMVRGPSDRIESRSEVSKPRMSAVMLTIEVMPMTTPRMVSAERILLAHSVSKAISAVSRKSARRFSRAPVIRASSASIGASRAARRAGYQPKNRPTSGGDQDADHHRPGLDRRRERRHRGEDSREDRRPGRRR